MKNQLARLALVGLVALLVGSAGSGTAWGQDVAPDPDLEKPPVAVCDLKVTITEVIEVVDLEQRSDTLEAYYQAESSTPEVRFTSRSIEYFVPVTVTVSSASGGKPIEMEDPPDESIAMDPAVHTIREGSGPRLQLGLSRGTIDIVRNDLKKLIKENIERREEDKFGNLWTIKADWRDAYARISITATDGDDCPGSAELRQWLLDPNMRSRIIAKKKK